MATFDGDKMPSSSPSGEPSPMPVSATTHGNSSGHSAPADASAQSAPAHATKEVENMTANAFPDDNRDNDNFGNDPNANFANSSGEKVSEASGSSHFSPGLGMPSEAVLRPTRRQYTQKSRTEMASVWKEREERTRKVKEQQEEERRQKADEWRLHAIQAQRFREQQDYERKRALVDARAKEQEKRSQIEERRRAMEFAERERREAMMKRNLEREQRFETRRKSQGSHGGGGGTYAFGSSTPRVTDSEAARGARRSTSSTNVHGNLMSQSLYVPRRTTERSASSNDEARWKSSGGGGSKKSTSVYGLNKSGEGDSDLMAQSFHAGAARSSSNRCRTDVVPTVTASACGSQLNSREMSRASTPGRQMLHSRSPGLSQAPASSSKPPQSESKVVRLRNGGPRKPRPASIAISGMSQSVYEKRPSPMSGPSTPTNPRNARLPSNRTEREDDGKINSSSTKTPARKTVAQVKAASNAKKNKAQQNVPIKSPTGSKSSEDEEKPAAEPKKEEAAKEERAVEKSRGVTPDIISGSDKAAEESLQELDVTGGDAAAEIREDAEEEQSSADAPTPAKRIITSEEEAKVKLAEKRREMKEKMEREAELERQRQAELERLEEERRLKEEEEERMAMEEAERLASEARKAEEERLQRAIADAQRKEEEERQRRAEEERVRKEAEQKAKEEAERKQAELEEKLKREEEERLARKKRIEQIMARTRGGGNKSAAEASTASPDTTINTPPQLETTSNGGTNEAAPETTAFNGMTALENTNNLINKETAIKPDLLGDLTNTNVIPEKRLNDEFDPFKAPNSTDCQDEEQQPVFDQILDLSSEPATRTGQPSGSVMVGAPIIAFEDATLTASNASPRQEVPTGDLLS